MEQIREICEERGLKVAEIRQTDEVLVVVPASLDALPAPEVLADLAQQLREASSCRYVTLAIDEPTPLKTTRDA